MEKINNRAQESKILDTKWKNYGTIAAGILLAGMNVIDYPELETFDIIIISLGILIAVFGTYKLISKS